MAILITGVTGFIGQNLKPYLQSRFSEYVGGLDLRSDWRSELGPDTKGIVHLAGKAHDLKKSVDFRAYFDVNYELTKELYQVFLKSSATTFIFVSSVKAAADSLHGPLTEDYVSKPETDYGKSKLMAEEYIRSQVLPEGKAYFILRPCMVHGPGNKGNLNLLYKFVQKGVPYPLASFLNKRSFLSIENFCYVVSQLLEDNNIPSGVYNIADDEALSTNEVIEILAASLEKKPKMWFISKQIIQTLAWVGDKLSLPLNTERLNKLTENYIVSNHKIKQALRNDLPVKTKEGLMHTAKSFKYSS